MITHTRMHAAGLCNRGYNFSLVPAEAPDPLLLDTLAARLLVTSRLVPRLNRAGVSFSPFCYRQLPPLLV